MPKTADRPSRGRLLRRGAAVALLLALAGYLVGQYLTGGRTAPRCRVVQADGGGASYEFTAEQAVNAATISAVGTSRKMPERAVTIALATALQESGLRNLGHGDRDSLGLFQQRPSQGWGDRGQIMDPVYSSQQFYKHLAEVPGYSRLPLTVAAQRVQRSGYPQAYAKHEPDATLLAAALTGRAAAGLSCEGRPGIEPGDPERVRTALVRDFGRGILPESSATGSGKSAGGGKGGSGDKGDGDTVTVPVPASGDPAAGTPRRRGWALAHWAVANSSALRIEKVTYAGREWRASDDGPGPWREVSPDKGSGAGGSSPGEGGGAGEVRIGVGE
ncbi:heavy metal transporter [Streptomyces sp. NA04227]|uniref:heavy metal transporter n=1 Tax=Streptomyces sp. NA04227 TaxID=2742136 RepID=UPI0015902601|nr:heavy metal transporter [Streptomyces sp. NA04227]QKW08971.1 heavy metal transporter [Streptomyces sp. NA04227]